MALPGVESTGPLVDDGAAAGRRNVDPSAAERAEVLARLGLARNAAAVDREILQSATKSSIHSVKVLGEGAFGIVDLVLVDYRPGTPPKGEEIEDHISINRDLLCVRKKLLKQTKQNHNDPAMEVDFFQQCAHCPFVIEMWSHVVGLYDYTLLLEYCCYGSLEDLLKKVSVYRSKSGNGCFDFLSDSVFNSDRHAGLHEHEARFWVANCVLGLESMHLRGLLHRDLKPGNILISENRYAKLGDLGLVKQLDENKVAHTHAGTPGYMAPEMVHKGGAGAQDQGGAVGYSFPADIWSLGMVVWELVDGALPKWAIMSWYFTRLHFPEKFSKDLCSLLSKMLQKSPSDRPTLTQIKEHAWFKGIDWIAMEKQAAEAPDFAELRDSHMHAKLLTNHLARMIRK